MSYISNLAAVLEALWTLVKKKWKFSQNEGKTIDSVFKRLQFDREWIRSEFLLRSIKNHLLFLKTKKVWDIFRKKVWTFLRKNENFRSRKIFIFIQFPMKIFVFFDIRIFHFHTNSNDNFRKNIDRKIFDQQIWTSIKYNFFRFHFFDDSFLWSRAQFSLRIVFIYWKVPKTTLERVRSKMYKWGPIRIYIYK